MFVPIRKGIRAFVATCGFMSFQSEERYKYILTEKLLNIYIHSKMSFIDR